MTSPTDSELRRRLQEKIDHKTKPPGSLGVLESIALQVGMIQRSLSPQILRPHIVVFAGDHGIADTGLVNPYPKAVTAQMVLNFINGGAAINVFCRQYQIELLVADAGVDANFNEIPEGFGFIHAKIARGTRNYLEEPAMTTEDAREAIQRGRSIVSSISSTSCNCIGFGEMGIGNTSAASLLMSAFTGIDLSQSVGRGTGTNDEQLLIKINTLKQVFRKHRDGLGSPPRPVETLAAFGGFEIAMMTGAYLEAAARGMIIVVDGFISTAALLVALSLEPAILDNCIFSHASGEQGHRKLLDKLGVKAVLSLGMRLGEGTGAALAIPIIGSAVNFLNQMASFESAGVSNKK
jgi:nicotinate-nucleotide--dimethylbenzimidazole phosphoribosyltransferase